jgi:hypothetical protein
LLSHDNTSKKENVATKSKRIEKERERENRQPQPEPELGIEIETEFRNPGRSTRDVELE